MRAPAVLVVLALLAVTALGAQFTINPTPNAQAFWYGQSQTYNIWADPTYPNVSLSLVYDYVTITPSIFNFTESQTNFTFTITAQTTTSYYNQITFHIDGDDAVYYSAPNFYVTIAARQLAFTGGYASYPVSPSPYVGVSTSSILLSLNPYPISAVTVWVASDPANAATFSANSFSFTSAVTSFPFTFTPQTTDPFVIYWTFTGPDAANYALRNDTVNVQKRSFVFSTLPAAPKVGASSAVITVSVNYLPPSPVTFTPTSDDGKVVFTPTSLTFSSTTGVQQFTYSGAAAGAHNIYWTTTGVDASWFNARANDTIVIAARTFDVVGPDTTSYAVGQVSEEYTISTQYPPESTVTLVLTATATCTPGGGVVLSTSTLSFSSGSLSQTFTVTSDYVCSGVTITAVTGGTQKDLYAAPAISTVVSFGKITVSIVSLDPTQNIYNTLYCGDTRNAQISLSSPPPNGFTVTLAAPGATFTPSTFVFTPTATAFSFTFTATYVIGTLIVHASVSGADSPLVNIFTDMYIPSSAKTVTAPAGYNFVTPGEGDLYVGSQSNQNQVTVNRPPATGLTVAVQATGLTFTPPSVPFTNKDSFQLLSVSGAAAGTYTVTYSISGADSACYVLSGATTSITVSQLELNINQGIQNIYVGTKSATYTLSIDNLPDDTTVTVTPTVLDSNNNPVPAGIYVFTPATLTLTTAQPSATFTYIVTAYRVTQDQFVFTTDQPTIVSDLTVFTNGVNLRAFTTPQYLTTSNIGNVRAAYVVIGVESLPYLVRLPQGPPPNGVTLRPTAPNTVFTPATLDFDTNTAALTFTITTSQGAGAAGTAGLVTPVTWTVEGTDAAIYSIPNPQAFYANLRTVTVASAGNLVGSGVYVGTAIPFTITTPYPPETGISFVPYGATFTYVPATPISIGAGANSVAFTATPTIVGNNQPIQFTVQGDDADKYILLNDISASVLLSTFTVNYPAFPQNPVYLAYGGEPYQYQIRANTAPESDVTLTFYSQQVEFDPPSFTFTPTALEVAVKVSPVYTPFAPPQNQITGVNIQYVITGTDALSFSAPGAYTFNAEITGPPRQLNTDGDIYLYPGRNATFVVSSVLPPINTVTITPTVVADTGYWFSPASADITPTTTSITFTVGRSSSNIPPITYVPVILTVSGPDAALYANNGGFNLNVQTSTIQITGIADNGNYNIGQTYAAVVRLSSPPVNGDLTISPYVIQGQTFKFNPAQLTFTAPTAYQTFTFTPTSRGTARIAFAVGGDAQLQYAFRDDFDVYANPTDINLNIPDNSVSLGGVEQTGNTITLSAPVAAGLNVHFSAPGFTFDPEVVSFAPGDVSLPFTFTATANNLQSTLITDISGPDATSFYNPCGPNDGCSLSSGAGTVYVSVGGAGTLQTTITVTLSTPTTETLTITPSTVPFGGNKRSINAADANGVTFVPASVTFADPTVTQQTIVAYATTSGTFNLYYQISGAAAPYFAPQYVDPIANPITIRFNPPSLSVGFPASVPAGSLSGPVYVYPQGAAPGVTLPSVTITPTSTPAGLTFTPSSVTVNTSTPVTFQYRAAATGTYLISYSLSGDGADLFSPIATTSLTISPASFTIPTYTNVFMYPSPAVFVYGVSTQYYTVYAQGVANNVSLQLYSDSLSFEPSTLWFGKDTHSATFRFTPTKVGPITISYAVGGFDAASWNIPGITTGIRATYKLSVPALPTQTIGVESESIVVSIEPPPVDNFVLSLSTINYGTNGGLVFSPAKLVFTPEETSKAFTVVPVVITVPRPGNGGLSIPGSSPGGNNVAQLTIGFNGHDSAETADYQIPTGNPIAVVVGPGWFSVQHPRYQLDVESKITIEISALPRADVTVSLFSNNLHLTPPYITFTAGGAKSQEISVVPRQTTSYELDYASFKVDYVLSGTNANDYITPSESLHYFAIPRGYIAAIVLVPFAVIVLAIVAWVVLGVVRGKSS